MTEQDGTQEARPGGATSPTPPPAAEPVASTSKRPVNPVANGSSSSLSSASSLQQIGSRQGTRSRSRTTRRTPVANAAAAAAAATAGDGVGAPPLTRYNSEDHPLSAHKLAARGYHSFSCLGVPFHVPKRYTFLRELGIGAYGCVALCRDEESDMNVAIKKVTRVFERDVLARRALREVAILRHMLKNQNCTALIDFDTTFIDFSEIYLVLSASEADLSQIIRSGQALSDAHLQYFAAQLLRGVRYMHAANIIHRDLKPGNLLVNADCALFICDFGLARAFAGPSNSNTSSRMSTNGDGEDGAAPSQDSQSNANGNGNGEAHDGPSTLATDDASQEPSAPPSGIEPSPAMASSPESPMQGRKRTGSGEATKAIPKTPPPAAARRPSRIRTSRLDFPGGPVTEYVSTRWYRAPEIMLGFRDGYGTEIDMWSVGCILAELASGRPLFDGKDYVDQIARIHGVLGAPDQSVLDAISSDRARVYVDSLPKDSQTPLSELLKGSSPGLVDLLEKLLLWDPTHRLSASEALKHPWLSAYHGIIDQWERPEVFSKFDEVELINSLPEFKAALQTESMEIKGEYSALFGSSQSEDGGDDGGDDCGDDCGGDDGDDGDDEEGDFARNSGGSADDDEGDDGVGGVGNDGSVDTGDVAAASSTTTDGPLADPTRRSSQSSSSSSASASSDSAASYPHRCYTTDEMPGDGGAASSASPITSGSASASASASASVSTASSLAGDLTLIGGVARLASRRSLPVRANGTVDCFPMPGLTRSVSGQAVTSDGVYVEREACCAKSRYRRRAISNAQRLVEDDDGGGGGGGEVAGIAPPAVSNNMPSFAPSFAQPLAPPFARRGSSHADAEFPAANPVDDLSTSQARLSPPCPQNKIAPSPDFKTFTTDLIARPKSEAGAFSSPALDAGDAFAQCVAAVVHTPRSRRGSSMSMSGGGGLGLQSHSRRGSHSSTSRPSSAHSQDGSAAGGAAFPARRRRSKADEMGGLISAIRAEAEKLKLSSLDGGGGARKATAHSGGATSGNGGGPSPSPSPSASSSSAVA